MAVIKNKGGSKTYTGTDSLANKIVIGPDGKPYLKGYQVSAGPDGGYTATKNNWLMDKGVPLGVAGIFGYGALGPGGYAGFGGGGGAATPAGWTGPATTTTVPAYGSMAGFGGPAAAAAKTGIGATVANAAKTALSGRDWLDLAMFGGQAFLNNSATNKEIAASDKAAQIQADSAQKQLDFLKQMWQTDQTNLAPYYAMGKAVTGKLSDSLMGSVEPGMPSSVSSFLANGYPDVASGRRPMTMAGFGMTPEAAAQPPSRPGGAPLTVQASQPGGDGPVEPNSYGNDNIAMPTMSTPGQYLGPAGDVPQQPPMTMAQSTVPLRAPDGTVRMIPAAKVPYYRAKWAQMQGASV